MSDPIHTPRTHSIVVAQLWLASAGLALTLCACKSATEYRDSADRQVYAIVEERRAALGAGATTFTIDPPADSLRQRLLTGEVTEAAMLDLIDCLEIASENSRTFQDRRERLYLAALDLTLERYRFQVQTSGTLGALVTGDGDGAQTASGGGNLGLAKLLGTGATIISNLGVTVFRNLAHGDAWHMITDASLSITQPLLAGSGERIVREPLTQAERNVVYAARDFERFRRTFSVDVASRLYRLLQQIDTVSNEEHNSSNLKILRERNEALAQAGRLSDYEVDQTRQDELSSANRLIIERQRYEDLISEFKLFLGLPITATLTLDPMELTRLSQAELETFELDAGRLDEIALALRLDYLTAADLVDDSGRKVEVAADALRARLDLSTNALIHSQTDKPLDFRGDDLAWTAALDMDLPIDRFPERNAYRKSLIAQQAVIRAADEFADQIRVDVREDLGTVQVALESYRIQQNAVKLAERRVESTKLNLEAGRANTRDILDAQQSLLLAQNAATRALIDYHLARLTLFLDLELLRIDPSGIQLDEASLAAPPGSPGDPVPGQPGAPPVPPPHSEPRS